tara:strand:- start:3032 stop:3778 length:747 start_codon:yes stop_codon:yes gene_type:complete
MEEYIKTYDDDFLLNLEGFEGPIDLLLHLARTQKVDLSKISILKLANQYLEYINLVKNINLEIASDYLVMASWLTFLKSKILLPKKPDDQHTAEELEEAVKFQLKRLEAMQNVSKQLFNLPKIGIETFYRGYNDGTKLKYKIEYTSSLFDLLKGYSEHFNKKTISSLKIKSSDLFSVESIMIKLKEMIIKITDWIDLSRIFPTSSKNNKLINKSAVSSTLVATLELVRNGNIEIKQENMFGPIYIKNK